MVIGPGEYFKTQSNLNLTISNNPKNSYKSIFNSKVPKNQTNKSKIKSPKTKKSIRLNSKEEVYGRSQLVSKRQSRTSDEHIQSPRNKLQK